MNWFNIPREERQAIYDRAMRKMGGDSTITTATWTPGGLTPDEISALYFGVDEPKVDYNHLTAEQVRQLTERP